MSPSSSISVTEPVRTAIEHMKAVLFRPFDLSRWFTIGFCAWLAWLGDGGGGGGGGGGGWNGGSDRGGTSVPGAADARRWLGENWMWLIPVVLGGLILVIALGLLILWLSSRGKFMFLHCVVTNRAEVKDPWHRYAALAQSVFLFRAALVFGGMVLIGLPALVVAGLAWLGSGDGSGLSALTALLLMVGLLLIFGVVVAMAVVSKFTTDFAVPLLYLRGTTCWSAWQELWALIRRNLGSFALYLLFQIVLALAVVLLILVATFATCCVAGCLFAIPYLGTVLLLPIYVFDRAYSLHFLRQFGAEYDLLLPPESPAAGVEPTAPSLGSV